MTWLLKLYPPRWRQRYGAELTALVAAQPFSLGAAFDLMAGAVDAWLHPQLAAADTMAVKGDATMMARMMRLKCAGYGPGVTADDKARSRTVNIAGSFLLAVLGVWSQWQFKGNFYVTSLLPMAFWLPYLFSLRYTALKGRTARTQTILIAGLGTALTVFCLLVGWIGSII